MLCADPQSSSNSDFSSRKQAWSRWTWLPLEVGAPHQERHASPGHSRTHHSEALKTSGQLVVRVQNRAENSREAGGWGRLLREFALPAGRKTRADV